VYTRSVYYLNVSGNFYVLFLLRISSPKILKTIPIARKSQIICGLSESLPLKKAAPNAAATSKISISPITSKLIPMIIQNGLTFLFGMFILYGSA